MATCRMCTAVGSTSMMRQRQLCPPSSCKKPWSTQVEPPQLMICTDCGAVKQQSACTLDVLHQRNPFQGPVGFQHVKISHNARNARRAPQKPNKGQALRARSHKRPHPEASPASWQRSLAGQSKRAGRSIAGRTGAGWNGEEPLGTEKDLHQAKFRKNVTALGLHRPATSNAITRKWHLVPVSNSGYLRCLSCSASWMACPCLRPLACQRGDDRGVNDHLLASPSCAGHQPAPQR